MLGAMNAYKYNVVLVIKMGASFMSACSMGAYVIPNGQYVYILSCAYSKFIYKPHSKFIGCYTLFRLNQPEAGLGIRVTYLSCSM